MEYKEYCIENYNRKFCDINGIKEANLKIETHPITTIKNHWIILLGVVALVLGFLLLRFDYKLLLLVIGFAALFFVLFLIGNKYSITCEKDGIKIKQHFQTIHLPFQMVKNVYVMNTVRGAIKTYVLVIRCEDKFSLLREFEFPLLCANKEEVIKFVDNFHIAGEVDTDKISLDKRREFKRIVGFIFRLTCAIIIAWLLIARGVIKLPH